MTENPVLKLGYSSPLRSVLRLAAFFGLIILLMPANIVARIIRANNPFWVSMIFYRTLMRCMGFALRIHGTPSTHRPTLFVANHTSYLDIPVLGALIPASFVAKAEVASWPMIGALAKLQGTIFIERRSSRVSGQRDYLREHLLSRRSMILFPEGTSTDGQTVLPFKSALFSIVEEAPVGLDIMIQPVSVTCTGLSGLPMTREWRNFYSWYGDMTLVGHLWNAFGLDRVQMDVVFHPPLNPREHQNRKALAQLCRDKVATGVIECLNYRLPEETTTKLPSPTDDHHSA